MKLIKILLLSFAVIPAIYGLGARETLEAYMQAEDRYDVAECWKHLTSESRNNLYRKAILINAHYRLLAVAGANLPTDETKAMSRSEFVTKVFQIAIEAVRGEPKPTSRINIYACIDPESHCYAIPEGEYETGQCSLQGYRILKKNGVWKVQPYKELDAEIEEKLIKIIADTTHLMEMVTSVQNQTLSGSR